MGVVTIEVECFNYDNFVFALNLNDLNRCLAIHYKVTRTGRHPFHIPTPHPLPQSDQYTARPPPAQSQQTTPPPHPNLGITPRCHMRKPESELVVKSSKEEEAAQNDVIKEIMADSSLDGVTKKRLIRLIRNKENLDTRRIWYLLKRALIIET